MRHSILAFVLSIASPALTSAFTATNSVVRHHGSHLFAESAEASTPAAARPIEEGSHEELMYALGINLARQLGDIRPLVENANELTQVARGLLDTVVGKLDEEGQRKILGRRGTDLNDIIVERA